MARIRVDTDLLFKNAEAIHLREEHLRKNEETLLHKILGVRSDYAGLTSDSRRDAYAVQETIRSIHQSLGVKADSLAALANAFRTVDDEAVSALLAMRGEDWFLRTFFAAPAGPEIDGFEPYFLSQTRMLLTDWVPVYVQGPRGLTQTGTWHTGRIVRGVVGTWKDPKTGKEYFVADAGGGEFVFFPQNKNSAAVDLSVIPDREGAFADGQRIHPSGLPAPFGTDGRNPEWYLPGDPWQNLILGRMTIIGIGNASFPLIPHHNLCGELSVLLAVGETDLEAGLSRFAKLRGLGYWNLDGTKTEYTGTQVLQNVGHTTSAYDVRRLFEEFGWEARISNGELPAPDVLAEKIQSGSKFVFLTELDTRTETPSVETGRPAPNPTYGQLVPGAPPQTPGRAAHWVTLTDVFQDGEGGIFGLRRDVQLGYVRENLPAARSTNRR
jgi:hypothetical protein